MIKLGENKSSRDHTKQMDDIIENMYWTVLNHEHQYDCNMKTYLICRMNSEVLMPEDIPGRKAETILTEHLSEEDKSKWTTITVYINNSPCHAFATWLIDTFLNENPNVILILYVTNLYNIRRMSCIFELHYTNVPLNTHAANVTGLKNLMEHGRCVVSAFSHAVWSELLNSVPVSNELKSEYLDGYKTILDKSDRSREDEDNRIRSDLVCIRCIPSVFQHQI